MSDVISMLAPSAEGKGKSGPAKDKMHGSSMKELGKAWGLEPDKMNLAGRTTRKSVQSSQKIPGGLEPAQEEREAQAVNAGLDPPEKSGGGRQQNDLDQLGEPRGDRSGDQSQPGEAGGDRSKGGRKEDRRSLSYKTDEEPNEEVKDNVPSSDSSSSEIPSTERASPEDPSTERTSTDPQTTDGSSAEDGPGSDEISENSQSTESPWRQTRVRRKSNKSEDDEVEKDLLKGGSESENGNRPSKYFMDWF